MKKQARVTEKHSNTKGSTLSAKGDRGPGINIWSNNGQSYRSDTHTWRNKNFLKSGMCQIELCL